MALAQLVARVLAESVGQPGIDDAPDLAAMLVIAQSLRRSRTTCGAIGWGRLFQVLGEERDDVVPQLLGGALAIARPVIGEKRVAGAFVDLCRHVLLGGGGALFHLRFERARGVLVLFAEHPEHRAMQLTYHV